MSQSNKMSVWILGDQLMQHHPALQDGVRVVLIESASRLAHRPYQRKKLVLLLSAMRHYAAQLSARGFEVDYVKADSFLAGLRAHCERFRPNQLITMASASYGGRAGQMALEQRLGLPVTVLPNTQMLLGHHNPIPNPQPAKRYVLEHFYRDMRRHFHVLMTPDGEPEGGQWNFDHDNRKKLPRNVQPPPIAPFAPDEITQQVMAEVDALPNLTGSAEGFGYAVTHAQAQQAFEAFMRERFHLFGDYEDALTTRSHALFHSVLSPYLNIGLLDPLEMVVSAEKAYRDGLAPLNAVEGFVRQILGWREFMYWQYWRQMPGMTDKNAWEAHNALPSWAYSGDTDMRCINHAVSRALETGYNHHIERLMVLSNYFMLTGVNPKTVNDWFTELYIDAYEWVMPPNVIGMSLNADGGLTATKPYISSANYINKMGDYCKGCHFNHKARTGDEACPFNFLYWNFVMTHRERLAKNPRTSRATWGLGRLDDAEQAAIRAQAAAWIADVHGE